MNFDHMVHSPLLTGHKELKDLKCKHCCRNGGYFGHTQRKGKKQDADIEWHR